VIGRKDNNVTVDVSGDAIIRTEKNMNKPKWVLGPIRAPSNVRVISRIDYQPDICKDYKETGYCGFGDNCKFMHDRGDYKSGWQLEREYKEQQDNKRKKLVGEAVEEEPSYEVGKDDDIPWACLICRKPFTSPVVTKCKHYFCERCALEHNVKDTKCFACSSQTSGIFNTPTAKVMKIIQLRMLDKKGQKEEEEDDKDNRKSEQGWAIP